MAYRGGGRGNGGNQGGFNNWNQQGGYNQENQNRGFNGPFTNFEEGGPSGMAGGFADHDAPFNIGSGFGQARGNRGGFTAGGGQGRRPFEGRGRGDPNAFVAGRNFIGNQGYYQNTGPRYNAYDNRGVRGRFGDARTSGRGVDNQQTQIQQPVIQPLRASGALPQVITAAVAQPVSAPAVAAMIPPVATTVSSTPIVAIMSEPVPRPAVVRQEQGAAFCAAAAANIGSNAAPRKAKKCYRCGQAGHRSKACTVPICQICEGPDHGERRCHLLTAPKPKILVYGYGHEEHIFFKFPCIETYNPKLENHRLASIIVSGGEMTIPGITRQLQRLVPTDDFVWNVIRMGHNVFQVEFPNSSELERLKVLGRCIVPNSTCEITFDSWTKAPKPSENLPEVWLRVEGIPSPNIGDYLALWAVGDMFGMTLEIDMPFTRKHGILQIRIGCINHRKIPKRFQMFIRDGFYRLSFEVEETVPLPSTDVDMVGREGDDESDDDSDGLGDDFQDKVNELTGKTTESASYPNPTEPTEVNQGDGGGKTMTSSVKVGFLFSPSVRQSFDRARKEIAALFSSGVSLNNDFANTQRSGDIGSLNQIDGVEVVTVPVPTAVHSVAIAATDGVLPAVPHRANAVLPAAAASEPTAAFSPAAVSTAANTTTAAEFLMVSATAAEQGEPTAAPRSVKGETAGLVPTTAAVKPIFFNETDNGLVLDGSMTEHDTVCAPVTATWVSSGDHHLAAECALGLDGPGFSFEDSVGAQITPLPCESSPVLARTNLNSPKTPLLAFPFGGMVSTAHVGSRKLIEDFGGILDVATSGVRSSDHIRSQHNADDSQMERAMMLAARRDSGEGYLLGSSLDPAMGLLTPPDQRKLMVDGCTRLLTVAHDFFSRHTWQPTNRLS